MKYPFEPRSNAHLEPGQFWAVPLSDRRHACGLVLAVPRAPDPLLPVGSRMFLAGLLDWVGDDAPTADSIAGSSLVAQGFAHVRSIRATGGAVLGSRPLELDGVEPWPWLTEAHSRQAVVYRGAERLRLALPSDKSLPVMSTWGFNVISVLAERNVGSARRLRRR